MKVTMRTVLFITLLTSIIGVNLFISPTKASAYCGGGHTHTYTVSLDDVYIHNMTSRWPFNDHDYIAATLTIGGSQYVQTYELGTGNVGDHSLSSIQFPNITLSGTGCSLRQIPIAFNFQIVNQSSGQSVAVFNELVNEGRQLGISVAADGLATSDIWAIAIGVGIVAGVNIIYYQITSNYCGGTMAVDQYTSDAVAFEQLVANSGGDYTGPYRSTRNYQRSNTPWGCANSSYDVTWSLVRTS